MKFKSLVVCSWLVGTFVAPAVYADIKSMQKDMRIMERIFETALEDSGGSIKGASVDTMYLAKQGIVFSFQSGSRFSIPLDFSGDWESSWEQWGENLGENIASVFEGLASTHEVPLPEVVHVDEAAALQREQRVLELEQLRENLRERKEHYRDYLRQLREISREKLYADKQEQAALEQKHSELEKEVAKLKGLMDEYKVKMNEYRDAQRKKKQLSKSKFIDVSIATLCDYSQSLKSLDDKRYVTLIFEGFAQTKGKKDAVYVFQKKQLSSCDSDEQGVSKLKQLAEHYEL